MESTGERERDPVVLIADVSDSRRLPDKREFQQRLWRVVREETPAHFKEDMATRFEVTAWDEWEGVLKDASRAWDMIKLWEKVLGHGRLSVGVGIGSVEGSLGDDPRKVTGAAFYRARNALGQAKANRSIAYIETGSEVADVNLAFLLRSALVRRLTGRQREVISLYERFADVTGVGRELGVTHQNISQILRTAEYDAIRAAEQFIQDRLATL